MQIAYLAFARLPTEKAHGLPIIKTCEALTVAGVDVTLVIPGRKSAIAEDVHAYYGIEKTFSLLSLNTPDWVRWGSLGWGLSALLFSEVAKWQSVFWTADIVYSRDAFVLLQYVLLGRSLVYEAHTAPTWVSTFVARRAHRVVVISNGLRDAYVARGVPLSKIVVAHDAIDPRQFLGEYDKAALRQKYGVPEGRVALYVGRIEREKGARTFAAVSELTNTHIVLIGSGKEREALMREYPKALYLPETKYRDLGEVLAMADVLVIPNSAQTKDASVYTSPLKAFAYLAAKKPIVATRVPALVEIFGDHVVYAEPDSPQSLAAAIENANTAPVLAPYTWDARATTILAHL
jgi:glycosyltransferase involved in cell wall biosynthesis